MSIAATYVSATSFTATIDTNGNQDLTGQCAVGTRIRAHCGTDGVKYGVVTAVSYSDPTTTMTISGDALTSNLTCFDHGNDTPSSLANHGHTGPADGGVIGTATPTANKIPIADASGLLDSWVRQGGECRLTLSGSNLLLSRYNGYRLVVDNVVQAIPSAGVTVSATGLTANTTYCIYAFMSSGVMTLEASTTAYAADSRNGIMVKSGDTTRTLVGMARTNSSGAWADSLTQRFVLSYYNRRIRGLCYSTNSPFSTSSTTAVDLSSDAKLEFLSWGDDASIISFSAGMTNTINYANMYIAIGINGSVAIGTLITATQSQYAATLGYTGATLIFTKGYNYATAMGQVVEGSATCYSTTLISSTNG